jgi:hypothetical protein
LKAVQKSLINTNVHLKAIYKKILYITQGMYINPIQTVEHGDRKLPSFACPALCADIPKTLTNKISNFLRFKKLG